MSKNHKILNDKNGNNIVLIKEILFHGKRKMNWKEVENYLKQYVGNSYKVFNLNDTIHIGKDFPDEFCGSNDTARLQGALAKAKANAAQGIPQLIENATNVRHKENLALKHEEDAKHGWYRYTSRFALPVYGDDDKVDRCNVYRIEILVRQQKDGKMFLYDLVNIKKETSTPLES